MSSRAIRPVLAGLVWLTLAGAASPAAGQLIGVKSVPVAAGDQFLIHPSRNLAMGGVSIALRDPLLDPFTNPARAFGAADARLFGSPTFYSVSNGDGSARTLPVGAVFGSEAWFGGLSVSLQQLEGAARNRGVIFLDTGLDVPLSEQSATNLYVFGTAGRHVPGTRFSIGASVLYADLEALDGVDLLYALSQSIEQSGHVADLRLALAGESEDGSRYEAMLLHHRIDMTHDVTYFDWICCADDIAPGSRMRVEKNLDQTNTWGVHLAVDRPIGEAGWRLGGVLTGNVMSHPKIPNYEIVNIPRDPGHSTALDIGIGVAKQQGATTFGMDVVYEPAWSSTWAEAAGPVPTVGGDTIPSGGRTVENEFRFSNAQVRMGVTQQVGPAAFQAGLELRAYDYHLDQWDNVTDEFRRQDEQWMEWTPTWGARVRFPGFEVRYIGRVTTGTGRPGIAWTGIVAERAADAGFANDIVVPPGGPLTLQEVHVWTHQLSVAVPIR